MNRRSNFTVADWITLGVICAAAILLVAAAVNDILSVAHGDI